MQLAPGTQVTSEIQLVRELSKSTDGSVWVADHRRLGRRVALKLIAASQATHREALARFNREATAASQITSPHVVKIFEHGTTVDGLPYIAMELLDGETLADRLGRQGMLTLDDGSTVLRQVGNALDAAHARGIIHRSIGPENIFIVGVRERVQLVKVLDFGTAKAMRQPDEALTATGVIVGSPEYMSPEQLLGGKDVDFRTDLWALAAVTYRMICGEVPFRAESGTGMLLAVTRGQYRPLSDSRAPIELETWFRRAFEPNKDKRFGSAREMVLRFEQTVSLIETLAEEDSPDEDESTRLMDAKKLLEEAEAAAAELALQRGGAAKAPAKAGVRAAPKEAERGPDSDPLGVTQLIANPQVPGKAPEDDGMGRTIAIPQNQLHDQVLRQLARDDDEDDQLPTQVATPSPEILQALRDMDRSRRAQGASTQPLPSGSQEPRGPRTQPMAPVQARGLDRAPAAPRSSDPGAPRPSGPGARTSSPSGPGLRAPISSSSGSPSSGSGVGPISSNPRGPGMSTGDHTLPSAMAAPDAGPFGGSRPIPVGGPAPVAVPPRPASSPRGRLGGPPSSSSGLDAPSSSPGAVSSPQAPISSPGFASSPPENEAPAPMGGAGDPAARSSVDGVMADFEQDRLRAQGAFDGMHDSAPPGGDSGPQRSPRSPLSGPRGATRDYGFDEPSGDSLSPEDKDAMPAPPVSSPVLSGRAHAADVEPAFDGASGPVPRPAPEAFDQAPPSSLADPGTRDRFDAWPALDEGAPPRAAGDSPWLRADDAVPRKRKRKRGRTGYLVALFVVVGGGGGYIAHQEGWLKPLMTKLLGEPKPVVSAAPSESAPPPAPSESTAPPSAAPLEPLPPAPSSSAAGETGRLTVRCVPPCSAMWLDEKPVGAEIVDKELPPGRHKVVLSGATQSKVLWVDVVAGQTVKHVVGMGGPQTLPPPPVTPPPPLPPPGSSTPAPTPTPTPGPAPLPDPKEWN
jgi:serine/threonine-protein kinase